MSVSVSHKDDSERRESTSKLDTRKWTSSEGDSAVAHGRVRIVVWFVTGQENR